MYSARALCGEFSSKPYQAVKKMSIVLLEVSELKTKSGKVNAAVVSSMKLDSLKELQSQLSLSFSSPSSHQ
jgi:hypothetical protein